MHNHWKVIQQLAIFFEKNFKNGRLIEVISRSKEEIFFHLLSNKNKHETIKLIFHNKGLLFTSGNEFKKSSVDQKQFEELKNKEIINIKAYGFDRSFSFEFENDEVLLFKCYGAHSNIVLLKGNVTQKIFRTNLKNDFHTNLHLLQNTQEYVESKHKKNEEIYLKYNDKENLYEVITYDKLEYSGNNVFEALDIFTILFLKNYFFIRNKNELLGILNSNEKKNSVSLLKINQRLKSIENTRSEKEIADIIMANLTSIEAGISEKIFFDFYKESEIVIQLNPLKKPQDIASELYKKSRNKHLEIKNLKENILLITEELKKISSSKNKIKKILFNEELRNFSYLKKNSEKKNIGSEKFYITNFDGYTIYIGKNAKSNDELITRHTLKNDMWLHAYGCSGSHVIIKNNSSSIIPETVINFAASLAAYYSKNKNSTLVPVAYTERKYIRKSKSMNIGEVKMERYKIKDATPKGVAS